MKKICVVTGTRAEYGLLRWVMQGIKDSDVLDLQVIATGMHLSPEFGLTYLEIEADGFFINRKIEMLLSSDTPVGVAKSMGLSICGFADALAELSPDMLLVLGDRYEIFAAASAAMIALIPIVHLHGGESTEGAFDEAVRHSITKMSSLHFVAAEEYRQRVIQLGEIPERVFQVGGLGVDNLYKMQLLSREELEAELDFEFGSRNLLVTFHPATMEYGSASMQMSELLSALETLQDTRFILTMPNADTDGRILFELIKEFVQRNSNIAKAFTSLGQLRYLSCIRHVDGVIGNSSSGLLEVPSFKKGTVNIGNRQRGRIQAASVLNCEPRKKDIQKAIQRLYTDAFQSSLETVVNPYGQGGASEMSVDILERSNVEALLPKRFHNLTVEEIDL